MALLFTCLLAAHFTSAQQPYRPQVANPMNEDWRYARFPELEDLGIRHMASVPGTNEFWFAIDSGITSYNGYDWTFYSAEDGLSGLPVQQVFIDKESNIYAATATGLFKKGMEMWTNQLTVKDKPELAFHSIRELADGTIACAMSQGILFVGKSRQTLLTSKDKLKIIENQISNVQFVTLPSALVPTTFDNFSDVFEFKPGQLWLGITYSFDDELGDVLVMSQNEIVNNKVEKYALLSRQESLTLGSEQSFFREKNGQVWIVSSTNKIPAQRFNGKKWEAMEYGKLFGEDEYSKNILQTDDGKIWISSVGNLYCLEPSGEWLKFSSETFRIPQTHVQLYSSGSDLWIYGYQSTVSRVDLSDEIWLTYQDLNYQAEQSDGTQWFIDFDGNVIFNKGESWNQFTKQSGLIDTPVSLFVDSRDVIWAIGSHKGVAAAGYYKDGIWTNLTFPTLSWGLDYRAIIEAKDGSIWLGGATDVYLEKGQSSGLVQIKRPDQNDREIIYHRSREKGLNQLNVYGISESADTQIWIGGSSLLSFDGESWKNTDNPHFKDFVNDVHSNSSGKLFVASRQHGFFVQTDNGWRQYSLNNGLISNNILALTFDEQTEEIWLATDKDFSYFNGETWINRIFPQELTLSYEGGSIFRNNLNELWISRSPREWKRREYTGKIPTSAIRRKFTSHRVNSSNQPPETLIEIYTEEVDKSGNTTIVWTGRHYFNKKDASTLFFSYKLNDDQWSEFSNQTSHTFTELSSGTHTFSVRAMDTEGNIDESPAMVTFKVTPPVWKQAWFILLIISFLIIVGVFEFRILKKREILKKLNKSLQTANQELEERNTKIEELSQAKVKFFTNITHEFRTPLSLILGPIEKLSTNQNGDPTVQNFYGVIKKNALRLQKLINQLLEIRRIEAGNFDLKLVESDFVSFVNELKNLFSNQAQEKDIRLIFHSDYKKLTISFDQDKVEKIVFNLLSNAFKHTPPKGKIHIRIEAENQDSEPQMVKLIVEDNGTGMDQQTIEKLFERFAIGSNDKNLSTEESSGIGLSYIKDLVEAHQGIIAAESEVGVGTKVTVRLPTDLIADESTDESTTTSEVIESSISPKSLADKIENLSRSEDKKYTVLIVEDNLDMRYFIMSLLSADYNVLAATNGADGIDTLDRKYVDLVISDIMMPEIDGLTLCQRIKTDPIMSHIPVILLTAMSSDDNMISGYESGADSFITKPFNPDLLLARVQNLLSARENLKVRYADDLRFKPKDIVVTSFDEDFLDKLSKMMEENVSDSAFDVSKMCEMANMSHMHFIRKVKQLTGKKPIELLKTFRLTRAKQLLEQNKINVSEVGYLVGYDLPNSFTRAFKNEFGTSPTKFVQDLSESKAKR